LQKLRVEHCCRGSSLLLRRG